MDDRQRQITEGAGLEESRINTEFLDWLNRWGSTILMAVLVIAVAYLGWNWWERRQVEMLDNAFYDLDQAIETGSPQALVGVAEDWPNRGAVAQQALLHAAEVHLRAANSGLAPGAAQQDDGTYAEEDLLNEAAREEHAAEARDLYQRALSKIGDRGGQQVLRLRARAGVASAMITLGEFDQARATLEEVADEAEAAGFAALAANMRRRLDNLDRARAVPPLLPRDQIATGATDESAEPDRSSLLLDEPIELGPPNGDESDEEGGDASGRGFGDFMLPPPTTGGDAQPDQAPGEGEADERGEAGEESPGEATPAQEPQETPPPGR